VKQALIQKQRLRAFDLQPRAERERVTLRGDVNTVDQYETAGRTARRVEGVGAVANELTVDGRPVADRRPQAAPGSGAPKNGGGDGAVYHMVRTGDTLWNIANQYGTSVQRIQVLNDLHPDALRPGQRIRVR
jgi:LysM repeat protein